MLISSWLVCSVVILATLVVSGEQSNMVKASPASPALCGFGHAPTPASPSRWPVAGRCENTAGSRVHHPSCLPQTLPFSRISLSFSRRSTCRTHLALSARKDRGKDGDTAGKEGDALDNFYERASGLLADADGKLDSLSFGRKWRAAYPNDSLDSYRKMAKGTVGEILAASDRFNVTNKPRSSVKTFALAREVDPPGPGNASVGIAKDVRSLPDDDAFDEVGPATASEEGLWEVDLPEGGVQERQSSRGYKFSVVNVRSTSPIAAGKGMPTRPSISGGDDDDEWDDAEDEETVTPTRPLSPDAQGATPADAERDASPSRGRTRTVRTDQPRSKSLSGSEGKSTPLNQSGNRTSSSAARLIDAWAQSSGDGSEDGNEDAAVGFISSAGVVADAAPYTRLIQDHSRAAAAGDKRALDRAFKVLDEMQSSGVEATLMTYTALISACAKSAGAGHGVYAVDRGMQALQAMQKAGVKPDIVAYNALLDSCAKAASSGGAFGVERGFRLFKMLIDAGLNPTIVTFNTLMHTCAKSSSPESPSAIERANELMKTMENLGVKPDIVTYNALIDTCARAGSGGLQSAISVLDVMRESDMTPDIVTFNSLINACARAAGLGEAAAFTTAMQVLAKMQESGVDANVVTFNSLMTIIAKSAAAGDIPDAGAALSQGTQVVGMMLTSDISPNIITFNALVTAIVKAGVASREGCKEELASALNLMAQAEVQPNSVTSVLLMDWFVADGLTISESGPAAVELLEEVGLEADCGSFKTMVDTCARSGNGVRHIIPILERMEAAGCMPSIATWNTLLGLLVNPSEGGIDVGVEILTIMRRADVPINQATFAALANVRKAIEKGGPETDEADWLQTPLIERDQLAQPGDIEEEEDEEEEEEVIIGDENDTVDWIIMRPARMGRGFDELEDEEDGDSGEGDNRPGASSGEGGASASLPPWSATDAEPGQIQ